MATQYKTRIRETPEPEGTIGLKAAARKYAKYGISQSTISRWVKNGEVNVAKVAAFPGDTVLLDEASLRRRISAYTPHRDNQGRRTRARSQSRTIPEMQAFTANGNGASTNGHSQAVGTVGSLPSSVLRPTAPARQRGDAVLLNTREWLDRFYAQQARGSDTGELNTETKGTYDWTFNRFAARFSTLPMDPVEGRKTILDYIHGLTNLKSGGGPLSGGAKSLAHRVLSTFYNWLKREHGFTVPDLTQPKIARRRTRAVPIWPNETKATLKMARNHSEKTIIMLLAQMGVRLGELCTIRPECLHDGWVEVWGKPTRVNPNGYRTVPVPSEALADLRWELRTYGELVWVDSRGQVKPLAGPLEPTMAQRAIDIRNPDTYKVRPNRDAEHALQSMLRKLMKAAGVYEC